MDHLVAALVAEESRQVASVRALDAIDLRRGIVHQPTRHLATVRAEAARGLVNYAAAEIDRIKGAHTRDLPRLLGYKGSYEVIHRDDLVVVATPRAAS